MIHDDLLVVAFFGSGDKFLERSEVNGLDSRMKEKFGKYIYILRAENGLMLTKLTAALDINQSRLPEIENCNRNVSKEMLPKLSNFFNLDIKQLEKEYFSKKR